MSHPIYFVTPRFEEFSELEHADVLPENLEPYFVKLLSGHDIWTTQTFIFLKQAGLPVHLSKTVVPGEICVLDYYQFCLSQIPNLAKSYVVGVRTDTPRPYLCDETVVINRRVSENGKHHYVDHWPQPILTPRDSSRGSKVENIEFKGRKTNLWPPLQKDEFINELEGLGTNYIVSTEENILDSESLYRQWGDYSNCDVLVALRNLTKYDADLKPALKLINAWHAGVPALLGPEPAYQELRRSPLDFIEINSADDVIKGIKYLKENPSVYQDMVDNGKERAKAFTVEVIAEQWRDIIEHSIYKNFSKWRQRNIGKRAMDRLNYPIKGAKHKLARWKYIRLIQADRRILD